jgi:ABC-2 type transport system permease protein
MQMSHNSDLNTLMRTWGIEMPENTFAGDKEILAQPVRITGNVRSDKIIGYLDLVSGDSVTDCFDKDSVITGQLNLVEVLYAGVLRETVEPNQTQEDAQKIAKTPLIMTTEKGNSFSISSPYEMMMASELMKRFLPGNKPVVMGYLLTGRFKSSFPDGIEIEVVSDEGQSSEELADPNEDKKTQKHIAGLTQATEDCAVIVFSDVDFISDILAYESWFFGKRVYGDNSTLMLNSIDVLSGSSDLVSIRSRGNFKKPFVVVDEIKKKAEAETAEEVARLNQQIANCTTELQSILASAKEGQEEVVGSSIIQAQREIELKKHEAQRQLNEVQLKRRERIEHLGNMLRNFNMLAAPLVILVIAVLLSIRRGLMKRHYISHTSDA